PNTSIESYHCLRHPGKTVRAESLLPTESEMNFPPRQKSPNSCIEFPFPIQPLSHNRPLFDTTSHLFSSFSPSAIKYSNFEYILCIFYHIYRIFTINFEYFL